MEINFFIGKATDLEFAKKEVFEENNIIILDEIK